jgi:hypothetical protein
MNRPEIAQITVIRYTNHVTGDHARVTQDNLWFDQALDLVERMERMTLDFTDLDCEQLQFAVNRQLTIWERA